MADQETPVPDGIAIGKLLAGVMYGYNLLNDTTGADAMGLVTVNPDALTLLGRAKAIATAVAAAEASIVAAIGDIPGASGGDASAANQSTIIGHIDGIEALLTNILAKIIAAPATEATLGTIAGYLDTVETLIAATNTAHGTGNAALSSIDGHVDGLETLITATNAALATLGTKLDTIDGRVDGLEGLATSLNGYVDGLETLMTALNGYVDGLEGLETAMSAKLPAALGPTTKSASLSITHATDDPLIASGGAAKTYTGIFNVAGVTLIRPANATAYGPNESISDNGTAGSVTALSSNNLSDTNDAPIDISEILLSSTDTGPGTAGISIRLHLFNSDPTASSGVVGGDNAAWSNKKAGWVGSFSGVMRAFSDGSVGVLIPDEGTLRLVNPVSGAKNLYWQLQTLGAFTPSANSTTFTPRFKGFQARAA